MQTLFKLTYSLVVAILFILLVILGIRTFYDEPEEPSYPDVGPPTILVEQCAPGEQCPESPPLTEEQRRQQKEFERVQLEFEKNRQEYEDERADYHRNVFILASVLGVGTIALGLYLFRRVEAMPLGLLLGGLGVVIFGWVQAAEDFGEIGESLLFAVVAVGLGIVLAAGYRYLGLVRPTGGDGNGGDA
jgi:hypothetical protein